MVIPSADLIERIKRNEGFRAQPYLYPDGFVAIGYGHNLEAHPVAIRIWDKTLPEKVAAGGIRGMALREKLLGLGMVWDKAHAEEWLRADVRDVMKKLHTRCTAYRQLVSAIPVCTTEPEGAAVENQESDQSGQAVRAEVLIDMAFNLSVNGLLLFRNTVTAVERGDYAGAQRGMLESKWARQAGRRAQVLAYEMRNGAR